MKAVIPNNAVSLQKGAQLLMKEGFDTSPGKIFGQLRNINWIEGRVPATKALQEGLLVKVEGSFRYGASGNEDAYSRAGITYKGLAALESFLLKKNLPQRARRATEADLFGVNGAVDLGNGNKCELGF